MANDVSYTLYTTTVNGEVIYEGHDKADAIRRWDAETHASDNAQGGISVQSYNSDHVMVRDGWLLRVTDGRVYLSPHV